MMLATTTVEDFDRFLKDLLDQGAEKRRQHGSKGSTVFRDPNRGRPGLGALRLGLPRAGRSFVSDPEVPAILNEAGHKSKPQAAELGGQYGA